MAAGLLDGMDIARHIALIDELCFRPFPAEHGPSDGDTAGPGHFTAVLECSCGPRDGDQGERAVTVEQYEKYRDALHERLALALGGDGALESADGPPAHGAGGDTRAVGGPQRPRAPGVRVGGGGDRPLGRGRRR